MEIRILGLWGLETVGETPSFLIKEDQEKFLIDVCPNITRQLFNIGVLIPEISHVFISHSHADHFLGLPYLIFARSVQERTYPKKIEPLTVVSNKKVIDDGKSLMKIFYPDRTFNVNWKVINSGETIELNERVQIKALEVNHTVPTTAFQVVTSQQKITYSADTLPTDELINFAKNSHLLIQEAFGTEEDFGQVYENLKHSLALHAGIVGKKVGCPKMLLFHMHVKYYKKENRQAIIDEVRKNYNGEIIFTDDLDIIKL